MARLTRQELKKDEFAERFGVVRDFYFENQRTILWGGGIVALAAVLAGLVFLYVRSQSNQAAEAFAQALVTFHAPVIETPPPNSTMVSFKTPEERYAKALGEFEAVAERFSRYAPGRLSRYYVALCQKELGKFAEAEQQLQSIAGGSDPQLAALAKMALAGIYRQTERSSEAEKLYQELETNPAATVPKATVQLELAELYRETQPQRSVELYQQIEKDYPGTSAGDAASRKLQELPQGSEP